jgi:hypothetical protein
MLLSLQATKAGELGVKYLEALGRFLVNHGLLLRNGNIRLVGIEDRTEILRLPFR